MVNISFRLWRSRTYGAIFALMFAVLYLFCIVNAFLRDDANPQLVLVFYGFPTSWLFLSIFDPLLEWLGPFGSTARRVGEWSLLGIAGIVQYWLIGFFVAHIIVGKRTGDNDRTSGQ